MKYKKYNLNININIFINIMKVYIVYSCYHYDDYKRADSSASIEGVFKDENNAYDFAINKLLVMFKDRAKYNHEYIDCENHKIDKYWKDKENYLQCEYCGVSINEDCTINLDDEDNLFSKEHILSVIIDKNKTKKEIYNWIQDNLYDNILISSEFTMMPTHTNYFVYETDI
jgi:hypothetical protein